jgi:anaerobic ribonucleoside-triphosphate reductase activating protein
MTEVWKTGGLPQLNVALTVCSTHALGPGLRAVVWVQGCCFRCPDCISTEWIPMQIARLVSPEELVEELIRNSPVNGVTISGGEPMLQAAGLSEFLRLGRLIRDLTVVCFTGFEIEELQAKTSLPGVAEFLDKIDVLIDGKYISSMNDGIGLRGSTNQRIHRLTGRLAEIDFENMPRRIELRVKDRTAIMVGVPPSGFVHAFDQAVSQASQEVMGKLNAEKVRGNNKRDQGGVE